MAKHASVLGSKLTPKQTPRCKASEESVANAAVGAFWQKAVENYQKSKKNVIFVHHSVSLFFNCNVNVRRGKIVFKNTKTLSVEKQESPENNVEKREEKRKEKIKLKRQKNDLHFLLGCKKRINSETKLIENIPAHSTPDTVQRHQNLS